MTKIAVEALGAEFDALVQRAEAGEAVTVTRAGRPVLDLVARPEKRPGRLDFEAADRLLTSLGIERRPGFVADDFDAPLPEDFLIRSMPEP